MLLLALDSGLSLRKLLLVDEVVVHLLHSLCLAVLLLLDLLGGRAGGLGLGDGLSNGATIGGVAIILRSALLAATGARGLGLRGGALAGGCLAGSLGTSLTGGVALLEVLDDLFGPLLGC